MIDVISSGSGIAKIVDGVPAILVSDTMFVFDLTPETEKLLETNVYDKMKINITNIFQLERYKDDELYREGLTNLIRYGIFKNQDLCDKVFVMTTKPEHTAITEEVWPKEQREITKFRYRKWPTDTFCKEFIPIEGSGTVSESIEKLNRDDILSWFFEIAYSEEITTKTFPFDPEDPKLPIPLDPWIEMPPIPDPPSSGGGDGDSGTSVTYSIIYYYWNEYTDLNFTENHARPMGSIIISHAIPQNNIRVHVYKQMKVEIVSNTSSSE